MPKKYFRRKKTTKKPTLKRQVAIINKLVKQQKPELKHYDVGSTGVSIDNNPTFALTPCRNISNGTTDFGTRVGDKILQKAFKVKAQLFLAAASTVGERVRVFAFIYKKNPDQVVSTWATVVNLYLSSTTMNTSTAPFAFLDWDNHSSFKTLYDKTHTLNVQDSTAAYVKNIDFTIKIPSRYQKVSYVASSAAPSDNELYVGVVSTTDTLVTMAYNTRYYYTDP